MNKVIRDKVIMWSKKALGIPLSDGLNAYSFIKYKRLKYGPYFYKGKYGSDQVLNAMKDMGMKEGSVVFIHSSWDEFYNYTGTENDLIDGILNIIGPSGTLLMPAYPFVRKNKIFNLKTSSTKAGLLAEEFRKYPGVKRSINIQHSVCALGPLSDYLLGEHHIGDNCWDEKSPYFKLSLVNALVFSFGLHWTFIGTMVHCVEGVLWRDFPYYRNMFTHKKVLHKYIDVDGIEKSYSCYDVEGVKRFGYLKRARYYKKYINFEHRSISNLNIKMHRAAEILPIIISNGRKGIVMYSVPKIKGYKFDDDNDI